MRHTMWLRVAAELQMEYSFAAEQKTKAGKGNGILADGMNVDRLCSHWWKDSQAVLWSCCCKQPTACCACVVHLLPQFATAIGFYHNMKQSRAGQQNCERVVILFLCNIAVVSVVWPWQLGKAKGIRKQPLEQAGSEHCTLYSFCYTIFAIL